MAFDTAMRLMGKKKEERAGSDESKAKIAIRVAKKVVKTVVKHVSMSVVISIVTLFMSFMMMLLPVVVSVVAVVGVAAYVDNSGIFSLPGQEVNAQGSGSGSQSYANSDQNVSTSGGKFSVSNHGHKAFKQSDYKNVYLNEGTGSTVSSSGCGLCSWSAIMASFGSNFTPADWVDWFNSPSNDWFPDTTKYWYGHGMTYGFPPAAVKAINSWGALGQYEIADSITGTTKIPNEKFEAFVRKNLDSNTRIMISSSKGLFTNGGHILVILDWASQTDDTVCIIDSSGVAAGHMKQKWADMQSFAFPLGSNESINGWVMNNNSYNIKSVWAIRKVG